MILDVAATLDARDGATSAAARTLAAAGREVPDDARRLDVARAVARDLADRGRAVGLVRGGATPALVLAPTRDRAALDAALAALVARDVRRDPAAALRVARSAAPEGAQVHWASDVPPPTRAGVTVHDVAGTARNVGLVGLERVAGDVWLRIASTHPGPRDVAVTLARPDGDATRATVRVPGNGAATWRGPAPPGSGPLRVALAPPAGDALALDDVAWLPDGRLRVALDREAPAWRRALGAVPGAEVRVTSAAARVPADLRLLHGRPDARPPSGATLHLPAPGAATETVRIAGWDEGAPLLAYVDLADVAVAATPAPLAERGVDGGAWRPLAWAADGDARRPLLERRAGDGPPTWRAAFDPAAGDLARRVAFPVLALNLADAARQEARLAFGAALPPGTTRDGVPVDRVDRPGRYRAPDGTVRVASLLAEPVTRLPAPQAPPPGAAATPGDAEASARRATDLRTPLLLLALAALVADAALAGVRARRAPSVAPAGRA